MRRTGANLTAWLPSLRRVQPRSLFANAKHEAPRAVLAQRSGHDAISAAGRRLEDDAGIGAAAAVIVTHQHLLGGILKNEVGVELLALQVDGVSLAGDHAHEVEPV